MMFGKYKKIIFTAIVIILMSGLISFLFCVWLTPKLYLIGNDVMLEFNTKYVEPGYKAYVNKQDITNRVKIDSNVNIKKVGNYRIIYTIKYSIFDVRKIRNVRIVDSEDPVIDLVGEKEVKLCPGSKYIENGYKAYDNYDGDVTNKVNVTNKDDEIIYKVSDTYGNIKIEKRKLIYDDIVSPIIELKGGNTVSIASLDNYEELGFIAHDNCDGDITKRVEIVGKVNSKVAGKYTITYKVSDSSGNEGVAKRVVNVVDRTNKKGVIYLTFDDGPSIGVTDKILDILKQKDVKATFFVINKSNNLNYLIKREYDEGHTVGLHSYSHDYGKVYSNNESYIEDLNKINLKVKNIIGIDTKIIRFPGGSSNTVSKKYQLGIMSKLVNEVQNKGYHYFDWNIASGDAGGVKSSKEVYNNVIANLSKNRENIILMHDFENNYYTLNAIEDIIHYGKENGYIFKKITLDTPIVTHKVAN